MEREEGRDEWKQGPLGVAACTTDVRWELVGKDGAEQGIGEEWQGLGKGEERQEGEAQRGEVVGGGKVWGEGGAEKGHEEGWRVMEKGGARTGEDGKRCRCKKE